MPKRKAKPLTLKGEKKRIDSSRQKRRLNPEYLHNESERDKSAQQKRREDPEYLAHQLSRDNSTRRSRRELIKYFFYGLFSAFGISAGAHRLWSHRSYKANFKLQVLLMIMQTICIENDVIEWVRDHRVHHKFSDTDADPHNSQRGLFFSHMGWLLCKKHPDVRKYGSKVDMSDIESEPVLKFQRKFYIPLVLIFSFIIPIKISMYLVGHDLMVGICAIFCRYVISLHLVWFTNSFAHVGSWKPYDKNIAPSDSKFFGIICFGEGWHNFHHVFPWDYKVSELPLYRYNFTIAFIDFFSWLGWATDLKIASDDMIKARVLRTGDGSHPYSMKSTRKVKKLDENCNIVEFMKSDESYWGLGDTDIPEEDLKVIYTLNTH